MQSLVGDLSEQRDELAALLNSVKADREVLRAETDAAISQRDSAISERDAFLSTRLLRYFRPVNNFREWLGKDRTSQKVGDASEIAGIPKLISLLSRKSEYAHSR